MRILDKSKVVIELEQLGMADARARALRARPSARPTAPCSSPARPARASRRRSTRALERAQHAREEHHHDRGPGRVPARRASPRSRSTPRPGLTFATGLRSMMRADPDIIMVGEIRDRETAQIAIEARAHRPPRPLHAAHQRRAGRDHPPDRDGHRAVPRRLSAVDCVVAQRLARTLCQHCKRAHDHHRRGPARPTASTSTLDLEAYEPVGCARCGGSRLQGPDRPLRGHDGHRGDPLAGHRARAGRRRSPTSRCARACAACARTASRRSAAGRTSIAEVARVVGHRA